MTEQLISPKTEQFWAEMRSTCYLWSKSVLPSEEQTRQLINELGDILGNRILKYPPVLQEVGINSETSYRMKKAILNIPEYQVKTKDDESFHREMEFIKLMQDKAQAAQKHNWCWRITEEAKQLTDWYPFFITLTVDPKMVDPKKLWEDGIEFRKYIRKLANVAAREIGHRKVNHRCPKRGNRYASEREYVRYAGVLEHGKSREHHHLHAVLWMREVPAKWKVCPNLGLPKDMATNRECRFMRRYWKWAASEQKPALYFRFKDDIWKKHGHVCPIDKKTKAPIDMRSIGVIGNYITKYMQKDTKQWKHRMKATRGLGLKRLRELIFSLPPQITKALTWRPSSRNLSHSLSKTHSVPLGLVRSLAKQRNFWQNYSARQLDLAQLLRTNYGSFSKMLRSVRDGARPSRMHLTQFYDWLSQFLPDSTGYCDETLLLAHRELATAFAPEIRSTVKTQSLGAI